MRSRTCLPFARTRVQPPVCLVTSCKITGVFYEKQDLPTIRENTGSAAGLFGDFRVT